MWHTQEKIFFISVFIANDENKKFSFYILFGKWIELFTIRTAHFCHPRRDSTNFIYDGHLFGRNFLYIKEKKGYSLHFYSFFFLSSSPLQKYILFLVHSLTCFHSLLTLRSRISLKTQSRWSPNNKL